VEERGARRSYFWVVEPVIQAVVYVDRARGSGKIVIRGWNGSVDFEISLAAVVVLFKRIYNLKKKSEKISTQRFY